MRTVQRRPGVRTGLNVDGVDGRGHWRYLEDLPDGVLLTPDDVATAAGALRAARAVLVQLQQPPAAASAAREGGALVVLDGAPAADDLLPLADVLRADAKEAEQLTGERPHDAEGGLAAGRAVLRRGPSLAAIEVSGVGNAFVWPDGDLFLPLSETPTVDSTGAGDAFVAALTDALLRGESRECAARLAVAAAGATVGHAGGRPALGPEAIRRQLNRIPS